LLIDEGRQQEAIRDFRAAISLDPNCSLAIHNRAVTLAQHNETAAALRDFNRVIELNPGLAIAYRNRAELLAMLGRIDEALRDYTRAIEGQPDNAELYRARGSAWHRAGDFEQALADLNRAIELAPDADGFTQRGNVAAERGEFDRAIDDFRRALAIDPKWAEAYRSLAWLHATCADPQYRDPDQALAAARRAAELSPNDSFVLEALAAAYASAGTFDEAVRVQQQAIAAAGADFAEPLRQRLALYQQGQPFLSDSKAAVRAASHETGGAESR
jgi:tetratricopeptide (TPR) repeat protein